MTLADILIHLGLNSTIPPASAMRGPQVSTHTPEQEDFLARQQSQMPLEQVLKIMRERNQTQPGTPSVGMNGVRG